MEATQHDSPDSEVRRLEAVQRGSPDSEVRRYSSEHVFLALLAGLAAMSGCKLPAAKPAEAVPVEVTAQHHAAHPDVGFDRYAALADIQSPGQAQWFRVVCPDGERGERVQPSIVPLHEDPASLERGLAALLRGPQDTLRFDVPAGGQAAPPHDWRDFGTLLLSIHAPRGGVVLEFSVHSGGPGSVAWTQPVEADAGWNHLCIDLDEIGRHLDLSNVRMLTWRPAHGARPGTLYFDNLVLASRTAWLLGRDCPPGELYAFTRGARLFVGARERFELVFAEGFIVGWHADSPENLTVATGLGPWPIPLPEGWSGHREVSLPAGGLRASGDRGGRHQRGQTVVEASGVRVVVEGGRLAPSRSGEPDEIPDESPARERFWRYVIYPDGRVFVRVVFAPEGGRPETRTGFAVVLAARGDFRLVASPPAEPDREPAEFVLLSRSGAERADLFWTCAIPGGIARRRVVQVGRQQPFVVLVGDLPAEESAQTMHLLRFWPTDLDDAAAAERLAADYQHPVTLRPSACRVVTDAPGDLNRDGYNESEGCYEIGLHRGLARFEFEPGAGPRYAPVFRVHGSSGRRCWIYADGQALRADQRDADGRLLFTLPGATVRRPRSIEVHTRQWGTSEPP